MRPVDRRRVGAIALYLAALVVAFGLDMATRTEYIAILYATPVLLIAELLKPADVAKAAVLAALVAALAIPLHENGSAADIARWTILVGVGYLDYRLSVHIRMVEERETARQAMQDFLGMVAHDLKTPLTVVIGYAQILRRGRDNEARRLQGLEAIESQAVLMNRLVTDLVDTARIGSGKFVVNPRSADLVAIVRCAVEAQRAASPLREISLVAPESLPGNWDADRLMQVVSNLLSNAVKFSPDSEEIAVRVGTEDGRAVCTVADRGVGLEASQIPLLFHPYYRAGSPAKFAGAGLGLYISQGIAAAHGGQIVVDSSGKGSTFTMVLPLVSSGVAPA